MSGIVAAIQGYLEQYGYPVLFVVVLIESFGVPAPGQTLLIAAALLAATSHLVLAWVLLTAFAGAVIGDSLGYLLGRRGGRKLLIRYGGRIGITKRVVVKVRRKFRRYGGWFVTFARFFDVLRQINGIVAGSARMSFGRFILFNVIGAALWVSLWGFGSYYLGRGLSEWLGDFFHVYATWFLVAVLVFAIVLVSFALWHRARRARKRARRRFARPADESDRR
ncbi:MAG TPA: DedA family protein [Gammaproteobacteria bacterium]|nr:DedA family protein [Gammaproteobacteria bacterium]